MEAPNRIRELRLAREWSQQRLADEVGVSKVTISELERGKMQLTLDYMRRIAEPLDCSAAELLPLSANPWHLSTEEREMVERMRRAQQSQREQLSKLADVVVPWRGPEHESDAA